MTEQLFQVLFIVFLFCAWNITTVEINSGVHLLERQIREVPLFTSGGLGLGLGLDRQTFINLAGASLEFLSSTAVTKF